jgi:hypothetical protein
MGKVASALGPAINAVQLGVAAATGDVYKVGKKVVSFLASMVIGSLAIGAMSALALPFEELPLFLLSKYWLTSQQKHGGGCGTTVLPSYGIKPIMSLVFHDSQAPYEKTPTSFLVLHFSARNTHDTWML